MIKPVLLTMTAMLMLGLTGEARAADDTETTQTYTVESGDVLSGIVKKICGDSTSYVDVAADNKLSDADKIYPGQQLNIRCDAPAEDEAETEPTVAIFEEVTVIATASAEPAPRKFRSAPRTLVYSYSDPEPRRRSRNTVARPTPTSPTVSETASLKDRNLAFAPNVPAVRVSIGTGAAVRTNNPGNLKNPDGSWMRFSTPEEGFQALMGYVERAKQGDHDSYHGDQTLYKFFSVYAPSTDKNNPRAYAQSVANRLKVSVHTKISQIPTATLAAEIARHESSAQLHRTHPVAKRRKTPPRTIYLETDQVARAAPRTAPVYLTNDDSPQ